MSIRTFFGLSILSALPALAVAAPAPAEVLHNEQVAVMEYKLQPGETAVLKSDHPAVITWFSGNSAEFDSRKNGVKPGEVTYWAPHAGEIKNTGNTELHFVNVEFLTAGLPETWGHTGLAPNYKVLLENQYARVYDIRIPAHTNEVQHTHHARVVICLSGAVLKHRMPDGSEEPSTLKTGEVVWRRGATHIGQNLGDTDLWVIAVEPK